MAEPVFDVAQVVKDILAQHGNLTADQIDLSTTLEQIGVDSLGMAEVVFELEDHFDSDLPDSDKISERLRTTSSVGDLVAVIESQFAAKR